MPESPEISILSRFQRMVLNSYSPAPGAWGLHSSLGFPSVTPHCTPEAAGKERKVELHVDDGSELRRTFSAVPGPSRDCSVDDSKLQWDSLLIKTVALANEEMCLPGFSLHSGGHF